MRAALPVLALALAACCGRKQPVATSAPPPATTAQVLVYRTATDLRDRVPVLMSDDGTSIVSYPDPTDLRMAGGPPVPTDLGKGWLLDNRGIGPNVAFLRLTYTAYSALEAPPPLTELEAAITARDPLTELCDCGRRSDYTDVVKELRALVAKDALLTRCKKVR